MAKSNQLHILIVGGGIAGPACAFWLARAGHHVTVVERHPVLRASGTQVDLRNEGEEVVKRMGLLAAMKEKAVQEAGFAIVDKQNQTKVRMSFLTQETEIMRGDLVRVLYEATKDHVHYTFGISVESFDQDERKVHVKFSNNTTASYDLLIGADGVGSRIRRAILPNGMADPVHSLHMYLAYWFIPRAETDTDVARGYLVPGSKICMLRSANELRTQAYFGITTKDKDMLSLPRASEADQKAYWAKAFEGAGWETDRMVKSLATTDDFYCALAAQVKSSVWSKGRVVLVADAAHCPSVATGNGTTSAFVGSYILAGEIASHPNDLSLAFQKYESVLRPFAEELQEVPGVMGWLTPKTEMGIACMHLVFQSLNWIVNIATWLRLTTAFEWLSSGSKPKWLLPTYTALDSP